MEVTFKHLASSSSKPTKAKVEVSFKHEELSAGNSIQLDPYYDELNGRAFKRSLTRLNTYYQEQKK